LVAGAGVAGGVAGGGPRGGGIFVSAIAEDGGRVLPERVATHFNFSRAADGWMSRRAYLVLMASIAVVVAGLVPLGLFVPGMLAGNLQFQRLALWIACLTLGLLLGMHELTVQANLREPAEMPRTVWLLLAVYLLAISLWGLAFWLS
jgi:hypothetical protein